MRKIQISFLLLTVVLWIPAAAHAASSSGMDQIKALAGEWDGTNSEGKPLHLSYKVISGGGSVMETMQAASENMVTMYYPDGNSVMMTHYCMAQNQPRMKASASADAKSMSFNFVDATNLATPNAGHMRHLVLTFPDNQHLTEQWTWTQDGKEKVDTMTLTRTK